VSGDIINLRRARKARERAAQADTAAENRLAFGRSKTQRTLAAKTETLAQRQLEGHRLESSSHPVDGDESGG
jgi:hypothetical protein